MSILLQLLKLLARLPMRWYHTTGVLIGWLMYWCFPTFGARVRANLTGAGICSDRHERRRFIKAAAREAGKAAVEWGLAWYVSHDRIERLCVDCRGLDEVKQAQLRGKGIIFLLPHLGSFPIALRYTGHRFPVTALYRVPRQKWRRPFVLSGWEIGEISMAPTDMKGVEKLLRALKRGEAVALPPDQAPSTGGGVWADFFGRPAYTMTLAKKLQRATGAALFTGFAERLPEGEGYRVHYRSVSAENFDEASLNRALEDLVRSCPTQHNWSYNRYKVPRAAMKKSLPQKT